MVKIEWEYKLEGLTQTGQWIETNGGGGYYSYKGIYDLLDSHLRNTKKHMKNFRIWKRPKQGWELVLNVAVNEGEI